MWNSSDCVRKHNHRVKSYTCFSAYVVDGQMQSNFLYGRAYRQYICSMGYFREVWWAFVSTRGELKFLSGQVCLRTYELWPSVSGWLCYEVCDIAQFCMGDNALQRMQRSWN
jgi:hypothetical protein